MGNQAKNGASTEELIQWCIDHDAENPTGPPVEPGEGNLTPVEGNRTEMQLKKMTVPTTVEALSVRDRFLMGSVWRAYHSAPKPLIKRSSIRKNGKCWERTPRLWSME